MSVRRLAEENVQPGEFSFNRENAAWAKKKIKDFPKGREASAVIPLLMRAQEQDGWVTRASIEHMADMLNMPYIRVLEVATFYTQFQLKPVGTKAHIQVCGTTPCMLRGSEDLMKVCKNKINKEPFKTNEAGTLSWEEVECLGSCVNAPMIMVFKDTYEDLTPERLEEIIDLFEAGKGSEVPVGTQIDRIGSAPIGGLTALTSDPNVKKSKPKKTKPKKTESATAPTVSAVEPSAKAAASKSPTSKSKATPAKKARKAEAVADLDDKNRPQGMERPADIDDLKQISGIGPKIEGILHELGIFKFEQVAKWKKAESDWVDGYLSFKGRIERDGWIEQAKAFAKGGQDE